jgi:hypothetical protein
MLTKSPTDSPVFTGNLTAPSADINGGTIDGTIIGGTTRAAGNFTTVSVSEAAGANVTIGTSRQYGSIEAPKYTDINFVGFNDITNARIRSWDEAYSTTYGRLTFYTGVNGNISENARIDYNGNVGIGTTNPTAKLDVNGTANFNGIVTMPNQPAFTAFLNSYWTHSGGVRLVEGSWTAVVNQGSCYNTSTRRFTAPVAGKYLINVCAADVAGTGQLAFLSAEIWVNGSRLVIGGWGGGGISYGVTINSSIITLNANDYVELGCESSAVVQMQPGTATGISGFLIG